MRILIDTNILLRIADPAHTIHPVAVNATATLRKMSHELLIVPQTLYEFWAMATRTIQANGQTLNSSDFRRFDHISVVDPYGVAIAME